MNTAIAFIRSTAVAVLVAAVTLAFSSHSTAQTLGEALNAPQLAWTTGGTSPWLAQPVVTHDGTLAGQSGTISHNQESWIETTVIGPGPLSFWWKVSSEAGYDFLEFQTNGVLATRISGTVNWQQVSYPLGPGSHTLRWRYTKDGSDNAGLDQGWLDEVSYVPIPTSGPPVIVTEPVSRTNLAGTAATFSVTAGGAEPLSYQWQFNTTNLADAATAELTLPDVQVAQAGDYRVIATNHLGSVTSSVARLTVFDPADLGTALNAPELVWTTGGHASWTAQMTNTHDGTLAGQSGTITHSQESWVETTVMGPGALSFWWKVSSEASYDFLEFRTNGTLATRISGSGDWQQRSYLLGPGSQTLRWRYVKDSSTSSGSDRGWLDEVSYVPIPTSGPPVVVTDPVSQVNQAGTTATFSVTAGGAEPLAYQWQCYSTNLAGATAASLTLTNVQPEQTGDYRVIVTNSLGSATSAVARLTVFSPADLGLAVNAPDLEWTTGGSASWLVQPTITHDGLLAARSGTITHSQQTWMETTVAGPGALSFWWKVSSEDDYDFLEFFVNGALTASISGEVDWQQLDFTLPAGPQTLRWHYLKDNSSSAGSDRGWLDEVSFVPPPTTGPPVILANPASLTALAGTVAEFTALAGGEPPLAFQWLRHGAPLVEGGNVAGVLTTTLTLTNVLKADAAGYALRVTNNHGSVTSVVATLSVQDPAILTPPASQIRSPGASALFTVQTGGTPPLTYQWRQDGVPLIGATQSSLALSNVDLSHAGLYDVVVSNVFDSILSSAAELSVNGAALDGGFNPGAEGGIYCFAVQSDGKILVGGSFSLLGGQPRANIARLNPDGTLDADFNPGSSSWVSSLAVQADGKILVGGEFTMLGGESRTSIGRLNTNGTLDTEFNAGAVGGSHSVQCLAVQPDGKILVGGGFTSLAGQSRNRIARLDADGTLDPDFNPGADWFVYTLAVQPDGKILVGGGFNTIGGQTRRYFARLNSDGTLDSGFNVYANDEVYCVAVQPDGKILLGGLFDSLRGEQREYIARLHTNGLPDASFNPGADWTVLSLLLQTDGKILVGGAFEMLGGRSRSRLGRLNADGTMDVGFNPGADYHVYALAIQPDGKILAGGSFQELGGQPRSRIGRLNNTEPATQSLTFDGASILWQRAGSGPEVGRATVDYSSSPENWISLGEAARTAEGWRWTNVALPPQARLRARGFTTGGYQNGSTWFVETQADVEAIVPLRILVGDGSFGLVSNQFGFNVTGPAGQIVVIEGSTNLHTWLPLRTNPLDDGPWFFSDAEWSLRPLRFYRVRLEQ